MADGGQARVRSRRGPSPTVAADLADWRIERAFAEAVRRFADLPAVEVGGRAITYAELDRRAEALARRLAARGVGVGDIVGLACEDVGQFAAGALGALRAGAAYFPLDLRFPLERTPPEVFEGAVRLIVGEDRRLEAMPAGVEILCHDFAEAAGEAEEADAAPALRPAGGEAAYLCYTSGTTGRAKAALIPHAGVRGLAEHAEFSAFRPGARIASCSTFAFDAITFEVWGALLTGACVVQAPLEVVRAPAWLAEFLTAARIDGAFLTTSLFNAVSTQRPCAFGGMAMLVVGGEAVRADYVRRVFESGRPPQRLLNGYGPTETTTFAACHVITAADAEGGVIPIGRPIPGREAHVLTPAGEPVAPGEEGELCIGGEAVALGYRNAPELTAEKFFVRPGAGRLYRTGDLARVAPDGTLVCLGRLDEQVKVKGYRIEPAGVAALLKQIAGVAEAAVVPREAAFGARQIVAFLVGDERLDEAGLNAAAARLMPDYMLPAAYAWVEGFPLKPNGKLDAAALLAGLAAAREAGFAGEGADEAERALAEIWTRNGCRARLTPDTAFHEVCDSLAMVGVMLDIEAAFGRRLPAQALEAPVTLRSMAAALRAPEPDACGPVRTFYIGQPWNMAPAPEAIAQALGDLGAWREIRVPPVASSDAAYDSIEEMAAILEAELTAVSPDGPYILVGHSFGGVLAFELARRLVLRGEAVERLVLLDSVLSRRRTALDLAWVRLRQLLIHLRRDPRVAWARVARRTGLALGQAAPNRAEQISERALAAMFRYRPARIETPALFARCTRHSDPFDRWENSTYGKALPWAKVLRGLVTVELDCTHAEIVRDPAWTAAVMAHVRPEGVV